MHTTTPIELHHCRYGEIASRSLQRFRHAIAGARLLPRSLLLRHALRKYKRHGRSPQAVSQTKFEDGEDVATLSRLPGCLGIRHLRYGSAAGFLHLCAVLDPVLDLRGMRALSGAIEYSSSLYTVL